MNHINLQCIDYFIFIYLAVKYLSCLAVLFNHNHHLANHSLFVFIQVFAEVILFIDLTYGFIVIKFGYCLKTATKY